MDYANPADGLYVLNGVLPEPDFPVVNPVLEVNDGELYLVVQSDEDVWRYDANSDTIVTQFYSGFDAGDAIAVIRDNFNINLSSAGQDPMDTVTKSDIIGRIG